MSENLGTLSINLKDEEELEEYLSRKEPGETCKFIITAKLGEIVNQQATFTVEEAKVKNYAEPTDSPAEEADEGEALEVDGPGAVAAKMMKDRAYEDK